MNASRLANRREFLRLSVAAVVGTAIAAACQTAAPTPTTAPPTPTVAPPAPTATTAPKPTAQPPTATPVPKPTAAPATATSPAVTTSGAYKASTSAQGTIRWLALRSSEDVVALGKTFSGSTFASQFPNIKVTIEGISANWYQDLVAGLAGGTPPDVFEAWADLVTAFTDKGQVTDLEPLVRADYTADQLKDFYPWQWRDFSIPTPSGAKIRFGMPRYVNVMFLWYNKDLFDKAGVKYPDDTWDHNTYAEAAIKLTKSMGAGKFGLFYMPWTWDRYWYKVDAWGGSVVDPNDNTKATFDSEQALAAFEWSRKLLWDDKAMFDPNFASQSFNQRDFFGAGGLAMVDDGFYPFRMATTINKAFRWGYAHVPKGPTGQRKVLGTTDGYSISKGSKAQEAAWELLKFVSGKDFQLAQVQSTGLLPIRFSVLEGWKSACVKAYPELADVNLDVAPKAMELGYPGSRQFFKKDSDARDIIVPALERIFVAGGTPVSYLKDVAAQVTAKMRA